MPNLLFIHIPRTGGTSIRSALGWSERAVHETAEEALRRLGREKFDAAIKFTVVRNPYSWLASYYRTYRASKEPFDRFIRSVTENPRGLLCRQTSRIITEGLISPTIVMFNETLAENWKEFAIHHGLPQQLPRKNVGRSDIKVEYTEDLANLVYTAYRTDFESLGYQRLTVQDPTNEP